MRHHRFTNCTGRAIVRDNESGGLYKSKLERHGFIRWLMHPQVDTARLQHPQIRYQDGEGKPHRYTGDLMVEFAPASRRRPLVVEFKYQRQLDDDASLGITYAAVEREFRRRGCDFILQTERDVYAADFEMMNFVFGYRNNDPHLSDSRLLDCVNRRPGLSLSQLVETISGNRVEQGELVAAVWRLVATHQLSVDFGKILDRTSLILPSAVSSDN